MINLFTRFEDSIFNHYKDMKGNAKCRNYGDFAWLGVTQGHQQHNHSIERIQLPI